MKKLTICLIEDDDAFMYLAKRVIRSVDPDIETLCFIDGDEAFDFISKNTDETALPDIILMDLNMPHMDGWAFLAAYSGITDRLTKKIPIYIMSSSISDSDISKAQANSLVADYHIKPMDEKAMQEIIAKFKASQ